MNRGRKVEGDPRQFLMNFAMKRSSTLGWELEGVMRSGRMLFKDRSH